MFAFSRNAWPRLFVNDSAWRVADANAAKRASAFQARTLARSLYQPDTAFLVGCVMLAGFIVNRGALLRGFSAGSYSCSAAATVWRHVLPADSRLHLRIGAISMPPSVLVGISDKGGDYPLGSVLAVQVVSDTACPWNQVEQSGVRTALKAKGIGLLALVDDCYLFGPQGHNYSHLVRVLDAAGLELFGSCHKAGNMYELWPGFDVRSADYLQHIALALACQDPAALMQATAAEHIPRMISQASWLVDSAGDCPILLEMKADPNDAADAFVQRSLCGLMDIRAFKATALGRAAARYVQDRLVQLPVAQTLDFPWFQALASVSALRNANDPAPVCIHRWSGRLG